MKHCPLCRCDYPNTLKYCTKDGTKLQLTILLKYCPVCAIRYAAHINKCPKDNVLLVTQAKPADADFSRCRLCKQYYPATIKSCPLHGIALTNVSSAERSLFPPSNSVAPLDVPPTNNKDFPVVEPGQAMEAKEENVVVEKPLELGRQTQPSLDTFSLPYGANYAASDRKFLMVLAIIVTCTIVGFSAYSLPKVWPRRSTPPIATPVAKITPIESPTLVASIPNSDPTVAPPSDLEIIQHVEPSLIQADINKTTTKGTTISPKPTPLSSTATTVKVASDKVAAHNEDVATISAIKNSKPSNSSKGAENSSKGKPIIKPASGPTNSRAAIKPTPHSQTASSKVAQPTVVAHSASDKRSPISLGGGDKSSGNTANTIKVAHTTTNSTQGAIVTGEKPNKPVLTDSRPWHADVAVDHSPKNSPNTAKCSVRQVSSTPLVAAKVVVGVANKVKLQTNNGYIYQFDLVFKELAGAKVRWQNTSAKKVSFAGRSMPISDLLPIELPAHGSAQYRLSIKMTGDSVEDWYGQLIYSCTGIDENNNPVRIEQVLLLDNSFSRY